MKTLPLSKLKRLTRPFANAEDEEEAFLYWSKCAPQEKLAATTELTRAHYRALGIDPDAPMDKTVTRITCWAETEGD